MAGNSKEVLIAEVAPGWVLFFQGSKLGWSNYVLRSMFRNGHPRPRPTKTIQKVSYWFGHNGERVARNTDMAVLFEHRPELYALAEEAAQRHIAECLLGEEA